MRKMCVRGLLVMGACVAALTSAQASLSVLTFDGPICGGPCSNYGLIDAGYGSTADVAVSYNHDVTGAAPGAQLQFWDINYSALRNVAWGGVNDGVGVPAITLTPLGGKSVTLSSFDLGAWPGTTRLSQITILSGNSVVYATGAISVNGVSGYHYAGPITSFAPLTIQWGPSGYNVGIDNVAFSVSVANGVPEPSTWAMMLIGFAGLGVLARRARRQPSPV